MSDVVRIVEVGPRDGLQSEPRSLSPAIRAAFIEKLLAAGLRSIEVGSFVSPGRVPQMAGTAEVLAMLPRPDGARFQVLVPNEKGLHAALPARPDEIAVFASASETFSRKNINCSVDESLARFASIFDRLAGTVPVRGYVSCAFGCPYEGAVAPGAALRVTERLFALGCYEVSIADSIGLATPLAAATLASDAASAFGAGRVALHFHDTRGQALSNILSCLGAGIRIFDASVAGLGGCPFAPGATGNVATEDVVFMLNGMGIETGIDLPRLIEAGGFVSDQLGKQSESRVARAEQARQAR